MNTKKYTALGWFEYMFRNAKFATLFALGSIISFCPVLGYCHMPDMMPEAFKKHHLEELEKKAEEKAAKKVEKYKQDKRNGKKSAKPNKKEKEKAKKHNKKHLTNYK